MALILDHLLVGAPTLEEGIDWLEERTGVRAAPGGSHPGLGTCNALASLGPLQYLEIIAPDPGQPGVETFYVQNLRGFTKPRVATWAARAENLVAVLGGLSPSLFTCAPPRKGSRVRPDGTRLGWTLAFPAHVEHGTFEGALPFLIEWESLETHPGRATPQGLTLQEMVIGHPNAKALTEAFQKAGIEISVRFASTRSIRVELGTPMGPVVLPG